MKDVFTSTGVLITPSVRELQLEFHELQRKKAAVVKALAPVRARYKELRQTASLSHPEFPSLMDRIILANEDLTSLDSKMGALTRAVEALHILAKDGVNARPGVATMGKPG